MKIFILILNLHDEITQSQFMLYPIRLNIINIIMFVN